MKEKKGISLITLIITIIVLVIIATVVLLTLNRMEILDSGKKAKFMNNFRSVEEGILLYMSTNIEGLMESKEVDKKEESKEERVEIASIENVEVLGLEEELTEEEKIKAKYPVKGILTKEERKSIKGSTLEVDILSKTGKESIMDVDTLYWVDLAKIGLDIKDKNYLLDVETMQVYEYEGEKIEDKTWHTLEGGISEDQKQEVVIDSVNMWDGWIKLTLYYPEGAENKEWRLSSNGEQRQDSTLFWQEYTGSIVIPVDRVDDVWIRYTIDGVAYTSGGTVDIEPDSRLPEKREQVRVKINYSGNNISKKEYRIDGSEWIRYNGSFIVYENCLIEARCRNEENEVKYADPVKIENIEKKEPLKEAPEILVSLVPQESTEKEEAAVSIYAPEEEQVKKIYVSINDGEYTEYEGEFPVKQNGTKIKAKYETEEGKMSYEKETYVYGIIERTEPWVNMYRYPKYTNKKVGEVRVVLSSNKSGKNLQYKIDEGEWEEYKGTIKIDKNCTVYAKATEKNELDATNQITITNIGAGVDIIPSTTASTTKPVSINIAATGEKTEYSFDNINWQEYTGSFTVDENCTIYARTDRQGEVAQTQREITNITVLKITSSPEYSVADKVNVYIESVVDKIEYKIDDGAYQEYTGRFEVSKNCKITAKVEKDGQVIEEEYEVDNIQMIKIFGNPKRRSTSKVQISISSKTEKIEYSLDEGTTWKEYTSSFPVVQNGKIMARGEYNQETYTDTYEVTNIQEPELDISITHTPETANQESVTVTITYDEEADKKLYKLGKYGELKEYTEPFEVENNTVIYAYCYGETEEGLESKGRTIHYIENIKDKRARPSITWTPTDVAEEVEVTVTPKVSAEKIYVKVGTGKFEEYLTPVKVTSNARIEAYYINSQKEESLHEVEYVTNIKPAEGPLVEVSHTPMEEETEEVEVNIKGEETATKIEYSSNGKEWQEYTGAFKVNKNCTIYARGITSDGIKTNPVVVHHITNVKAEVPKQPKLYHIDISANPEPVTDEEDEHYSDRYAESKVTIDFPEEIEKKYYQIDGGELQEYTGEFKVTENCMVKAVGWTANEENELTHSDDGKSEKKIDNLLNGIAKPKITATPTSEISTISVKIEIEYDRFATTKRYKIDNGEEQEYRESFNVYGNCTITAININEKGEKAQSVYKVINVIEETPTLAVDKGEYYIIRLTYPETATNRQYQFKDWGYRAYPEESGIIFIKKSASERLQGAAGTKDIKLEMETGEEILVLKENLYVIDGSLEDAIIDIDMKWDNLVPSKPVVKLSTEEPARELIATIEYGETSVLKEYKIVDPDGITEGWKEYNGEQIKVIRKDTVIVARSKDEAGNYSPQTIKKITNIDEEQPVIKLTGELEKVQRQVKVRVEATDDIKLEKVKWTSGLKGSSYFSSQGTEIKSGDIVTITENGEYTFYAEDGVGNKQVMTLTITNIDNIPPEIDIQVEPEDKVGKEIKVTIDYGKSTTKEYKIGESTTSYTAYTGEITITSTDILEKGLASEDKTLMIYARGTDALGNSKTEEKKVISLDLDAPIKPVITSNYGYPILTEYGVEYDTKTTITYDTRTDIENYYSLDGETWKKYTGEFDAEEGMVYAKSVKKSSGLEVTSSLEITQRDDALGDDAFDGDESTYIQEQTDNATKKMMIDSSLWGKSIHIKGAVYGTTYWSNDYVGFRFLNSDGGNLKEVVCTVYKHSSDVLTNVDTIIEVPEGTKYIQFWKNNDSSTYFRVNEITAASEPTFSATNGYMLLHADAEKCIKEPYQMINISYFTTSEKRLYRINELQTDGTFVEGEWKDYEDKAIKVNVGDKIEAKGIDKYGNDTRITSSYTSDVSDALGDDAFDGDESTYIQEQTDNATKKMMIDSSLWGKSIHIKGAVYGTTRWSSDYVGFRFLNNDGVNKEVVCTVYNRNDVLTNVDTIIEVPEGTKYIQFWKNNDSSTYFRVNEITVATE